VIKKENEWKKEQMKIFDKETKKFPPPLRLQIQEVEKIVKILTCKLKGLFLSMKCELLRRNMRLF